MIIKYRATRLVLPAFVASLLLVLVFGLLSAGPVFADGGTDSVTITATQDTMTVSPNTTTNYGTSDHFNFGYRVSPSTARWDAYIGFDLPDFVSTATVSEAKVCAYVYQTNGTYTSDGAVWYTGRITSEWSETVITYDSPPNLESADTFFWDEVGSGTGWRCMPATDAVQDGLDDGDFYGVRIRRASTGGSYLYLVAYSTEATGDYDPYLIITGTNLVTQTTSTWGLNSWVYWPMQEYDLWSHYKTYTETTWYGDTYSKTNIWEVRPGASAFPIAPLNITDVGQNSFGYYIEANINAWPDVPSTTVRYDGLASVTVAPGQAVGPNCSLGKVAPNPYLGDRYHLILYTEFDGSPINPVPYMTAWPDQDLCVPIDPDGSPVGPGAGEVPSMILEVCQACQPPSTWTNIGRWIVWLECQLQNLWFCYLIVWFNQVIEAQYLAIQYALASGEGVRLQLNSLISVGVLIFQRLVDVSGWSAQLANNYLSWLAGSLGQVETFTTGMVTFAVGSMAQLGARMDNLGTIIMNSAGNSYTYIYNEPGTNIWDVLAGLLGLVRDLVDGVLALLIMLVDFLLSLFDLLLSALLGLMAALSDTEAVDPIVLATGMDSLNCSQGGVWATPGASAGKTACFFLAGLNIVNYTIANTPLVWLPYLVIGLLSLGLLLWTASQFKAILPG